MVIRAISTFAAAAFQQQLNIQRMAYGNKENSGSTCGAHEGGTDF
jgi:aspartyl aminopeptidase